MYMYMAHSQKNKTVNITYRHTCKIKTSFI